MAQPAPHRLASLYILTSVRKSHPCISTASAQRPLSSWNETCSIAPQQKPRSPVNLVNGLLTSAKFLTQLRVIPIARMKRRTPVTSVGTGNSRSLAHRSVFVTSIPPALCSPPNATVSVTNSSSFLNDGLSLAQAIRGSNSVDSSLYPYSKVSIPLNISSM